MSLKTVFEQFEKIAATSGRNAKIALIDDLCSLGQEALLKEIVRYTYNPFFTYRLSAPDVNNRPPVISDLNDVQSDILWDSFRCDLDSLRTRNGELRDSRERLAERLAFAGPLYRKYLSQIVNRELKIGIQSFNRWFPNLIPAEPVMLCNKWDGEELKGEWIAEIKFDGYRAAVLVDAEGNVDAISRGNKEFWNWEHIAEEIKVLGLRNVVFDGEFYAGSWGQTSSICKTQSNNHPLKHLLKYNIFDMLTIEEWNSQKCTRTLRERKERLAEVLGNLPAKYLVEVKAVPVKTVEEFTEIGDQFYQDGHEGAVLKDLASVYVWDRTNDWLKIKPEVDCDVTVVDAKLGDPGRKHENTLGRFVVKGIVTYKKKQYDILSYCGGGLKDTERDMFWKMHQEGKLVGLVIQVKYQDVTTAICADSAGRQPSLRFPRFQRVRLDKTPIELGGI